MAPRVNGILETSLYVESAARINDVGIGGQAFQPQIPDIFQSETFNVAFGGTNIPTLGISQNIPQGRKEELYQIQDTVGWTIGKQSLRMGADIGRTLETDLVAQEPLGALTFQKGGASSSLENFFNDNLGASGSATLTTGPLRIDPHTWRSDGFVQDDIKLTPELTVNLGLRYDYLTDPSNSLPYPAINPSDPFLPINTVLKVHTDAANFGPRAGFAFAPQGGGWLGGGKTVIHGGAGIFYDTSFSNIAVNSAQSSPNAISSTQTSPTGTGLPNATSLLANVVPVLSPFSSVLSASNGLVNPRVYEWNFGVERELPAQLKLTLNYVGSRGRSLYANQQLNYFDANTGERLNANRGAINYRGNTAASQYDSIQLSVSRELVHGFLIRGSYVFGKNMDDGSEVFTTFAQPTSYPANLAAGGRSQDWGPSAFNFPQFFSVVYSWTPVGLHSSSHSMDTALGLLTRNWTVAGVTQLQSGPPTTFSIQGIDTNFDGSAFNDRPLVGNVHAGLDTAGIDGGYIDPSLTGAYFDYGQLNGPGNLVATDPSQVHWLIPLGPNPVSQEIGRNSFVNPGTTLWNLSLQKEMPAPWTHLEGAAIVLRAEAQNIFNHNDVNPLDTNILDIGISNYMNRTNAQASTNRNMLLWAKFVF